MTSCGCIDPSEEAEWEKEEKAAKATPIEINGIKMTLGDLFDGYEAKNVMKKLKLIELGKQNKKSTEELEGEMFGGGK